MSPFIESIKVLNGKIENLRFHQARFNKTRSEVFGLNRHPELRGLINIPSDASRGLFKCRILYDQEIHKVEYHPYVRPEIRSLKLISGDQISYPYKSADRSALTTLYEQRGSGDDILISKNGWITDSYYANVVFWDGSHWFTPEFPLLEGTMRTFLIEKGVIKTAGIRIENLSSFRSIRLINALNDWNDAPSIPLEAVIL